MEALTSGARLCCSGLAEFLVFLFFIRAFLFIIILPALFFASFMLIFLFSSPPQLPKETGGKGKTQKPAPFFPSPSPVGF